MHKSSFQAAQAGNGNSAKEEEQAMQAGNVALNCKTDDNDEIEDLEHFMQRSDERGVPLRELYTRCKVIAIIADETWEATDAMVTDAVMSTIVKTIASVIHIGYTFQKQRIKRRIFNLVEKVIIDIFQQGCLDTLLVRNVDKFVESERFMDALTNVW